MNTIKIDDHTIEVTKIVPETNISVRYNYDFLLKQRDTIQVQKDRDNAQRDKELTEVNELLAECTKVGVTKVTCIQENK